MNKTSRKTLWLWILIYELALAVVTGVITAIAVFHITDSNYMWLNGMLWFLICSAAGDCVVLLTSKLSVRLRVILAVFIFGVSSVTVIGALAAYSPAASTFQPQFIYMFPPVVLALFVMAGIVTAACLKRGAYVPCLLVQPGEAPEGAKRLRLAMGADTVDLVVENAGEAAYVSGFKLSGAAYEADEVRLLPGETFILTVDKDAAARGFTLIVLDKFRDEFSVSLQNAGGKYFLTR